MKAVIVDDENKEMGTFTLHKDVAKGVLDGHIITLEFGAWDGELFPHGIALISEERY